MTIIIRAQLSRASRTHDALALLLDPRLTNTITTLTEYHTWSESIWDILTTDATHRSDQTTLSLITASRLPVHTYRQVGPGGPVRTIFDPTLPIAHDFFGRDGRDAPRRGVDIVSGLIHKAKEAEVSLSLSFF